MPADDLLDQFLAESVSPGMRRSKHKNMTIDVEAV